MGNGYLVRTQNLLLTSDITEFDTSGLTIIVVAISQPPPQSVNLFKELTVVVVVVVIPCHLSHFLHRPRLRHRPP